MDSLPGLEKSYPLKISLKLVAAMESSHGSLYRMAESLLDQSLPVSAAVETLKIVYRHAGCELPEAELDDFILHQSAAVLLTEVLLDILDPIDRLGALLPGEALPAQKNEFT